MTAPSLGTNATKLAATNRNAMTVWMISKMVIVSRSTAVLIAADAATIRNSAIAGASNAAVLTNG
jgi:hypothetical protein